MALAIYRMAPEYYYSNMCLSRIYLAKGDLKLAEEYAAKGYNLLPSEDNEKYLAAVRKRISMEAANPPKRSDTK